MTKIKTKSAKTPAKKTTKPQKPAAQKTPLQKKQATQSGKQPFVMATQSAIMAGTVALIALKDIKPATDNIRTNLEGIETLAISIYETGLQQALTVRQEGKIFRVLMGSRRLAALTYLIDNHYIDTNYQVPCIINANDTTIVEECQLAENLLRQALSPIDEMEAFKSVMDNEQADIEAVARRFGVTVRHVKQRLKLTECAPIICDTLKAGTISLDVALAFTANADHERQSTVFDQVKHHHQINPNNVIRLLRSGSYNGSGALAKYVGRKAYEAKGGLVSDDLFADDVIFEDGELLEALAKAKLAAYGNEIAESEGWSRAEVKLNNSSIYCMERLILPTENREPTEDEKKEMEALKAKMEALEVKEGENEDAVWEEHGKLEAEYEAIEENLTYYKPEHKEWGTVVVSLDNTGKPEVTTGFVVGDDVKAYKQSQNLKARKNNDKPADKGLNAKLVTDLTAERSRALQLGFIQNPKMAQDFALFMIAIRIEHVYSLILSFNPATPEIYTSEEYNPGALKAITSSRETLNLSWVKKSNLFEQFLAFQKLKTDEKNALIAYAISAHFKSTENWVKDGCDSDHFAQLLGVNLRDSFTPDASFFKRLTKAQLLSVADELGGSLKQDIADLKKSEIVEAINAVFDGSCDSYGKEPIEAAKTWLPKGMAFPAPINEENAQLAA